MDSKPGGDILAETDKPSLGLAQVVARHMGTSGVRPPVDDVETIDEGSIESGIGEQDGAGLAELVRRANHDELTGLPNRSWFINAVRSERVGPGAQEPGAMFIIDLDGFKAINDTWGHNEGDAVLKEVGRRLLTIALPPTLAARLGGDEFALYVPNCLPAQANLIAERIIALVSEPIPGDLFLTTGASVGWVSFSDDTPVSALMSRADTALYAVKERGGHGHQRFVQELATARLQGRILQREIRHALRVSQFRIASQSIIDLRSGSATSAGAEVLSRWRHPRRGLLHPKEFLPAIAAAGSSATFDAHITSRLFDVVTKTPEILDARPLWINLSSESLNGHFVDSMVERIHAAGLDPASFVIEVSEDASAESKQATAAIEKLADEGLAIAIDDFGSGYSRLGAMKRLPITYVKIDRAFTTGLGRDDRSRGVTNALITLIRALGAEPVAEGIEEEADATAMAELGCHLMQGYLWGRPALINDD